MKKISGNDKGITKMVMVIIVVAVIAVAAIGAYLVLSNEENTYKVTYRINATIGEGQTVFVYIDNVQIDENSDVGSQIIQATHEYRFKGSSDQLRTLRADLVDVDGDVLRSAEYVFTVKRDVKEYTLSFPLL